jgi:hypothetical protein
VWAALINTPRPFTPTSLEPVLRAHHVVQTSLSPSQCDELARWSERFGGCFGDQDLEVRCHTINVLLADAATRPRISLHNGAPHLHYGSPEGGQLPHLRAITIAGLAYAVCFGGPDRLGRCQRDGCEVALLTAHVTAGATTAPRAAVTTQPLPGTEGGSPRPELGQCKRSRELVGGHVRRAGSAPDLYAGIPHGGFQGVVRVGGAPSEGTGSAAR